MAAELNVLVGDWSLVTKVQSAAKSDLGPVRKTLFLMGDLGVIVSLLGI